MCLTCGRHTGFCCFLNRLEIVSDPKLQFVEDFQKQGCGIFELSYQVSFIYVCDSERKPSYVNGKEYPIKLKDGFYIIRKLTVTECCRLQTMPDDYCRAVSKTQAYKCLGNGWTAEVVAHILGHGLRGVSRDEKIVVCSMYDGIATGRYVLDRLGFKNVKYVAYEIDRFAIAVALSNYPDVVEGGGRIPMARAGLFVPVYAWRMKKGEMNA